MGVWIVGSVLREAKHEAGKAAPRRIVHVGTLVTGEWIPRHPADSVNVAAGNGFSCLGRAKRVRRVKCYRREHNHDCDDHDYEDWINERCCFMMSDLVAAPEANSGGNVTTIAPAYRNLQL